MAERNIIDFHSKQRTPYAESPVPLPQLVIATRRTAKHHLTKMLPDLFSLLDDSLFALADKAESNQLQNLYFDAMREVRLQKDAMRDAYRRQLDTLFNAALATDTPATPLEEPASLEQASLVGDEQLEESLAMGTMISNAEMLYREALYGLTARLDFLIEDQEINKDNSPLRPEVICRAFEAAMDRLDTELKVRLLIYKLFDKHVMQQLGEMYGAINADLVAAGVLPRIKPPSHKSEHHAPPVRDEGPALLADQTGTMGVAENGDAGDPGGLFASLQYLLSRQRTSGGGTVGAGAATGSPVAGTDSSSPATPAGVVPPPPGGGGGTTATAPVYYAPQDIVSALSNLQTNDDMVGERGQASAVQLKTSLAKEIGRHFDDGGSRQIGQADTDAIDIVSMLFDFILDDPHIADAVKSLIARLQIPMLKVAIIDKEFFTKKSHPARQLLNELAYAGAEEPGTETGEENATYKMVGYVVNRILMEFEEDVELFTTLLVEFSQFLEQEREANRLAEEMLEQAKDAVANEIRQRVEAQSVPPFVRALLVDAWKDVLHHIYLRDGGEESSAWETALRVADDLIWSVQPKLVVSERQRLIRIIPRVLNGLRDGLTLISYDREITEKIFARLETLHLASLRGGVSDPLPRAATADLDSPQGPETTPVAAVETAATDEPSCDVAEDTDEDDGFIEEIILASTQAMDWDGWDQLASEYAETVKDMALGTWVEFIDAETEQRRRGKLAWKCDFTGEYTFVDRKYKVVADLTFKKLLSEFDLGRAQIIDDVPLFDRALDAVISGMKRAMEGRKEPAEEPLSH